MLSAVTINPGAHASLMALVDVEPDLETGGILVGHQLRPDVVLITQVSPPGPRAHKRRFSFSRDTRFLQKWLDRRCALSDGRDDYLGEWHVHHALDVPPSSTDRRSLWRIARRTNYPTDQPLLLIVEDVADRRLLRSYCFETKPRKLMQEVRLHPGEPA